MATSQILRHLYLLKPSSPDFSRYVHSLIQSDGEEHYLSSLKGSELTQLVDFLDGALGAIPVTDDVFRQCLHKLQAICSHKEILPSSHIIPGNIARLGHYPIASGGFADVWEGTHHGVKVCIKYPRITVKNRQEVEKAFYKEAILWKTLKHQNIIPFLGVTQNPLQFVSEWMPNGTLTDYLSKNPGASRIVLLLDVAEGLAYLHARPATHGDLKGPNVLIDHSGRARLSDFGFASIVRGLDSVLVTKVQGFSPRWAAPEVISEGDRNTREADVYAFGMVVIEVFTGRCPFSGLTDPVAVSKIMRCERPDRPQEQDLTDLVWDTTVQCWQQDPVRRPQMKGVVATLRKCYRLSISTPQRSTALDSTDGTCNPTPVPVSVNSAYSKAMALQDDKPYLGVTPPITTAESNPREKEATVTLMEELRRQKSFESEQEARTREIVLGKVAALVKKFVYRVSIARGFSEITANAVGGKIFTFGSYRLGLHGPGTGIDTLCIVPKHVSREDFFDVFESMLKEMDGVTEVLGIPDAYVPVINTEIMGVSLDLTMANLALSTIPENLSLKDDNLLRNLDKLCARSLNGSRVTDEILRLVPNVEVFRNSLRCVNLWAQRRAIYSNISGFLGGVAWAMLVARICQLYPNVSAGAVLSRFFIIMHQWSWPEPVLLKQIEDGPLRVRVWNPKLYPRDRSHRMPIITPAYPSTCATHNVTASTQMIMTEEFRKASEVVERVIVGTAEWSELFKEHDFFHKYKHYLMIVAAAVSPDLQPRWSGTVKSKLRQLVMKLEYVDSLAIAHPFIKGFDQQVYCLTDEEARFVGEGKFPPELLTRKKEDCEGKEGRVIYTTSFYIGLAVEPRQPEQQGMRKLDISYATNEFVKMVKAWDRYDGATMGVAVLNTRRTSLPNNVFEPDENQKPASHWVGDNCLW